MAVVNCSTRRRSPRNSRRPYLLAKRRRTLLQDLVNARLSEIACKSAQRTNLADSTYGWRNLLDGQRAAWAALAASPLQSSTTIAGASRYPHGPAMVRADRRQAVSHGRNPQRRSAHRRPTTSRHYSTRTVHVPPDTDQLILYDTSYPVPTYYDVLWAALTRGPSQSAAPNEFKIVATRVGDPDTQWVIHTEFIAAFPYCQIGDKFWCHHQVQLPNGLRSLVAAFDTIVISGGP